MTSLFDPLQLGDIAIANRVIMAPLTRSRATRNQPTALMADYYRQRASAGLIISEGAPISPMAHGYMDTPGIYTPEHVAGWRAITDAVHAAGGKMVCQLWHVGRISHASLLPDGQAPVSSTARPAPGSKTFTRDGLQDTTPPRALRDDEIPALIADYRHAAQCAMQAGFDGVEIHSANTYLLEQFLRDSVNDRSGAYGGSIAHRIRLVVEIAQAITAAIGAGRTGIRLSPLATFRGACPPDSQPQQLTASLLDALAPLQLAYVHMVEGDTGVTRTPEGAPAMDYTALRQRVPQTAWIVNNGYTRDDALHAVSTGHADAVAFGRPFISNPDLLARLRNNLPWTPGDVSTFYGGDAKGYTDYPLAAA